MLELPEVLNYARQLNAAVCGKTVKRVYSPTSTHRFCWFNGDVADYDGQLAQSKLISAEGFGIYLELNFDNGKKLCVNDGVNLRLIKLSDAPKNYQLTIAFTDGDALVFTVQMYGGIVLHDGNYDNEYYLKSRAYVSPFGKDFGNFFTTRLLRLSLRLAQRRL